jgi:hypothetical protein
MIILMVAVAIAVITALAVSRSGPRVTTIETRHEKDEGESK